MTCDANTVELGEVPIYLQQWYEGATEDELRGYLYATHRCLIDAYEELSFLERCLEYEAWVENQGFACFVERQAVGS